MVAPLRRVLVRRPDEAFGTADPARWHYTSRPDLEEARREHAVLVDLEANKYVGGGSFVGTGISFWDVTHSDAFAPAWMLHFGVPLGASKVYFLGEGRLFLKEIDDVPNNYQFWAGVRVHF